MLNTKCSNCFWSDVPFSSECYRCVKSNLSKKEMKLYKIKIITESEYIYMMAENLDKALILLKEKYFLNNENENYKVEKIEFLRGYLITNNFISFSEP